MPQKILVLSIKKTMKLQTLKISIKMYLIIKTRKVLKGVLLIKLPITILL